MHIDGSCQWDAEERSAIADLVETQHYFFPNYQPISELQSILSILRLNQII